MTGYVYLLIMVAAVTVGQLFIKLASRTLRLDRLSTLFLNKYLYLSFLVIMTGPFFVNLALDYFELSLVFAFTGLQYITVPLAARVVLGERVTGRMFAGMVLVVSGVALYYA